MSEEPPIPSALEPGTIIVVPGCEVMAWLSDDDGALVVQIDTPIEGDFANIHENARVYLNDSIASQWESAV